MPNFALKQQIGPYVVFLALVILSTVLCNGAHLTLNFENAVVSNDTLSLNSLSGEPMVIKKTQ